MKANFLTIVIISSQVCLAKKYLIKARQNPPSKKIGDDKHNDYMANVQIKSVDVGNPVELKCVSPKEFSRCLFSKTGEDLLYRIKPNSTIDDSRLRCLCDVSKGHYYMWQHYCIYE